jgi:hypothetical protein
VRLHLRHKAVENLNYELLVLIFTKNHLLDLLPQKIEALSEKRMVEQVVNVSTGVSVTGQGEEAGSLRRSKDFFLLIEADLEIYLFGKLSNFI